MSRLAAAAALAVALAACGGGNAEPAGAPASSGAATSPAIPTAPPDPAAAKVRAEVATALEECPCEVSVTVSASGPKPRSIIDVNLVGYVDPATGTAWLRDKDVPEIQVVFAEGRSLLTTREVKKQGRGYVQLDFAGVPANAEHSYFTMLAAADPAFAFALASTVSELRETTNVTSDAGPRRLMKVSFDPAAAVECAGTKGDLLGRLVNAGNAFGEVAMQGRALSLITYDAAGAKGDVNDAVDVAVWITKTGVLKRSTKAPAFNGTLDVTKMPA